MMTLVLLRFRAFLYRHTNIYKYFILVCLHFFFFSPSVVSTFRQKTGNIEARVRYDGTTPNSTVGARPGGRRQQRAPFLLLPFSFVRAFNSPFL